MPDGPDFSYYAEARTGKAEIGLHLPCTCYWSNWTDNLVSRLNGCARKSPSMSILSSRGEIVFQKRIT